MPRFFCEPDDISENTLILREDAHHITHVLRRVKGDAITVCDGAGTDFDCIIAETGDTVRCDIVARKPSEVEPKLAITLVQGLPKADKMEWIIQKNTELGVSRFIPLFCERSLIKLDPKKKNQKEDRWQNFDSGIAAQTFCLAAKERGLGTVILGYFDEAEIAKVMEIPEGQGVGALIAIGYPAEEPAPVPRNTAS